MNEQHQPHCPVPRMAAIGEGATCLCDKTRPLQQLAQEAMDVQDACNLSGVVKAWARAVTELWEHGRAGRIENFQGTRSINQHPICQMYCSKVIQLTGLGDNQENFSSAYNACDKLAKG